MHLWRGMANFGYMKNQTSRRNFLKTSSIATLGTLALLSMDGYAFSVLSSGQEPFVLPPLNYGFDALEPHIDARTMEIHYTKHHQTYVNKLNETLAANPDLKGKTLVDLLKNLDAIKTPAVRTAVRNNGGGHWNHSVFWSLLSPKPGEMSEELKGAILNKFNNTANFKDQFEKAAAGVFGSGWAWLLYNKETKQIEITTTANQDNPLMDKKYQKNYSILMGLDVWEHAYYLKYQNKRADYLKAFWNVLDWQVVSANFAI